MLKSLIHSSNNEEGTKDQVKIMCPRIITVITISAVPEEWKKEKYYGCTIQSKLLMSNLQF